MKKMLLALVMMAVSVAQAHAMSYEQARQQALFLTDKMAYELNLTEDQYEAAYEINLDYLMTVDDYTDLYGLYWRQRNIDLSYVLFDWQYDYYLNASYFYRPLYWSGGYWHFGVYARYPHRDFFYFGYPSFVNVYVGGHSWRHNHGRSWYEGRDWRPRRGDIRPALRDGYDRGDFGRGNVGPQRQNVYRTFGNGNRANITSRSFGGSGKVRTTTSGFGNSNFGGSRSGSSSFGSSRSNSSTRNFGGTRRESSTRSTVSSPRSSGGHFGGSSVRNSSPSRTFTPSNRSTESFGTRSQSGTRTFSVPRSSNFGGSSRSNSTRSFGNSSSTRSYSSPSRSFGSSRQSSPSTRSFSPSRSSSSSSSRSFGGGSSSSRSNSSGGGHFGGRR